MTIWKHQPARVGAFFIPEPNIVTQKRKIVRYIETQNNETMKFLTLDYIQKHSRIDGSCEAEILNLYGEAAEETVLNYLDKARAAGDEVEAQRRDLRDRAVTTLGPRIVRLIEELRP